MARPKTKPEIELPPSTQRLRLVVKESGLSNTEFARRIGMSSGGFGNLFYVEQRFQEFKRELSNWNSRFPINGC